MFRSVEPEWLDTLEAADPRAQRARRDLQLVNFIMGNASGGARTRLFIACEPRRSQAALLASRALGLLGCGRETRHDAVVSVRAGFQGRELSAAWPIITGWELEERPSGPFGHLFMARHRV